MYLSSKACRNLVFLEVDEQAVKMRQRKKAPSVPKKCMKQIGKNYKTLKTSWRVQTKLYFEHSSLHGVRYIAETGRPFFEKFMWFACVAIGAVATAVIIVSLWEKFQTNPTITGLDTDFHNWDVPFPAIFVCQEMPGSNDTITEFIEKEKVPKSSSLRVLLRKLTQLSYDTMNTFKNPDFNEFFNGKNLKEIAFKLMKRCEDIFTDCTWKAEEFDCCSEFLPVFTEDGFCYTFNSRHFEQEDPRTGAKFPSFKTKYIKETDIEWALNFTTLDETTNMAIYILNSDDAVGLDVQPQHIWNFKTRKMAFSVKQTYTTKDTRQLSIKQRHCVFSDEIKLKIDNIYTYTACTRQCRMDNAMQRCKCVPLFYPQIEQYVHCDFSQYKCIIDEISSIKNADHCSCQLGCSNTVYELEKLNENTSIAGDLSRAFLEVRFVSWPMVRYKREVLFGWVDLLVSFGGIAGLFLGFSLLSGVEIIYYFTIRTFCMIIKEKDELERIQIEAAKKPPVDYDLSLIPYFISKPFPGNGLNEIAKRFYNKNLNNNKVAPMRTKWNAKDSILPPFGIEFIN